MHYDYDYDYDNDKKQDTNSVLKRKFLMTGFSQVMLFENSTLKKNSTWIGFACAYLVYG